MRNILRGTHLGRELKGKSNTRDSLIYNSRSQGVDQIATASKGSREQGADQSPVREERGAGEFDVTCTLGFIPEFPTDSIKAVRQEGQGRSRACFGYRGRCADNRGLGG